MDIPPTAVPPRLERLRWRCNAAAQVTAELRDFRWGCRLLQDRPRVPATMTRVWSDISPRLLGQLVVLEPLAEAHEPGLFEAAQSPEIWRWWPFNPAVDSETFHRWLRDVLAEVAAGRQARFAVLDGLGRPIGSTSYCELRPEHRGLEIGWTWLTPGVWGTGVNAEAKLLLLRYAFEKLGCQRVEFYTDERNQRSRAALAALPAQFEGVLRDVKVLPDGHRRSSAVYSILDREWEDVERQLTCKIAERLKHLQDDELLTGSPYSE